MVRLRARAGRVGVMKPGGLGWRKVAPGAASDERCPESLRREPGDRGEALPAPLDRSFGAPRASWISEEKAPGGPRQAFPGQNTCSTKKANPEPVSSAGSAPGQWLGVGRGPIRFPSATWSLVSASICQPISSLRSARESA